MTTLTFEATTTELAVVNAALLTLGETPLDTLQDDHPLVPGARALLRSRSRAIQTAGWYFNSEERLLQPDIHEEVLVPQNTISLEICDPRSPLTQRGDRLFDPTTGSSIGIPATRVRLVLFLDFEELPEVARQYIGAVTVFQFASNASGDQAKLQVLAADVGTTKAELTRQHLRIVRPNLLQTNTVATRLTHIVKNRRNPF